MHLCSKQPCPYCDVSLTIREAMSSLRILADRFETSDAELAIAKREPDELTLN